MNLKSLLIVLSALAFSSQVSGQSIADALRYSYLSQQGSARSVAIGGAMGALGADFSAVSINPAGIGAFWKSELSFTPSWFNSNIDASLNGGSDANRIKNQFNLGSGGIVFVNEGRAGGNWKTVSLGLSMTKGAQYSQDTYFNGSTQGSITDRFAALADGLGPDQLDDFEAGIAYEVGAIFDFDNDLLYETDFQGFENVDFEKEQLISESGSYNDMNISLGANFKNRLLLGLAVGVPFLSYRSEKNYQEFDGLDGIPAFTNLSFREELETDGAGINVKVGAILKLNDNIRAGLSYQSPTYLSMTESFTTDITYAYIDNGSEESFTSAGPTGSFEYTLTTPWRATASASFLIAKKGFVSADVEYVDYSAAKFDFTTDSDNIDDLTYQEEVNDQIDLVYRSALNFRVGGELALGVWRARAGLQLLSSPFEGESGFEQIYAIGGGVRGNKAYLDAALSFRTKKDTYTPYQIEGAPIQSVSTNAQKGRVSVTVGFKI